MTGQKQKTEIYLVDGTFKEIAYDKATTVADVIKVLLQEIVEENELLSYSSFGLYSGVLTADKDDLFVLKDNKFIQDIVQDLDSKNRKYRLLLKRKFFYEADEAIMEEAFRKLIYIEASHDFLNGYYPFDQNERSDLANLSALQLLATFGSVDPEQYVDGKSYVDKCRPKYTRRGKDRKDIISLNKQIAECYLSMKDKMEKEEAERMFLSKLRKTRYRNSVFFCVKIADPAKILNGGDKIWLAINSFGMYFMKHDPRECLHSAELRDIKKYGCSDGKLTLSMQVGDGMHEFAFATKRAEEIIVALETAIQDQMNHRGTKASSADSDVSQPPDVSVCDSNQDPIKVKELNYELDRRDALIARYDVQSAEWLKQMSALEAKCSSQKGKIYELEQQLAAATQEKQKLEEKLLEAERLKFADEELRKKLQNTILDLKGKIRVFCRVRPSLQTDDGTISYPAEPAGKGIKLRERNLDKTHEFTFDKVFPPHASQQEVFMEISELVQSTVDGGKICLFSYGQTGSGKTFSMVGTEDHLGKGLIPRSLELVFQKIQDLAAQGWKHHLKVSAFEIYNEKPKDLLAPSDSGIALNIRELDHQFFLENITEKEVCSKDDALDLLYEATGRRSVDSTIMNTHSSRSHFVFTLKIFGQKEKTRQVQGVYNFIDLAGSERSGKSDGKLEETNYINKSLSTLGRVINALENKKEGDHVPFRESALTKVLQPCLDGSSRVLMLLNISPEQCSCGESLSSLRFAKSANSCETRPVRTKTSKV